VNGCLICSSLQVCPMHKDNKPLGVGVSRLFISVFLDNPLSYGASYLKFFTVTVTESGIEMVDEFGHKSRVLEDLIK
jgi:hypothetical protein